MSEIFLFLTPVTYWALIIMWGFILVFYIKKISGIKRDHLMFTLISILAIDAFRTLFESFYFGAWYTSLAGIIPKNISAFLMQPEMVFIPKLINVIAGSIVILILLKRWIPQEETGKSRAEEAFRISEEKFEAFTEQSFECISVADEDGNYTYVNPAFCQMMGYSEAELLNMTVFDMKSSQENPESFSQSKRSHEGQPINVKLRRKDGTEFPSEVMGKVINYGNTTRVLGVVRDISERLRTEEEKNTFERKLQHAQKLESLGILAGGIAHDFNNLLTAILGNAHLMRDVLPSESPAHECVDSIENASTRAADLAMQMLAYSGKGQFVIEQINPQELVEELTNLLEVSVSKKVEIKFKFSPQTPYFNGDVNQIRQVIMNLITNASESIGDQEGQITLSTGMVAFNPETLDGTHIPSLAGKTEPLDAGEFAFIEVADTGCGMDPATVEKVFDPFFTTKFTGRGLGMSAVLGIIRGHGGTITIESELGKGTRFKVLFPVGKNQSKTKVPAPLELGSDSDWKGSGTVLLADDEESVLDIGKQLLEKLGFDVLTATNGRDAVSTFRESADSIQCVLLDVTMPQISGLEALAAIREIKPDSKIILCSGYAELDVVESVEAQSDGFLHKPYRKKDLINLLRNVLSTG